MIHSKKDVEKISHQKKKVLVKNRSCELKNGHFLQEYKQVDVFNLNDDAFNLHTHKASQHTQQHLLIEQTRSLHTQIGKSREISRAHTYIHTSYDTHSIAKQMQKEKGNIERKHK